MGWVAAAAGIRGSGGGSEGSILQKAVGRLFHVLAGGGETRNKGQGSEENVINNWHCPPEWTGGMLAELEDYNVDNMRNWNSVQFWSSPKRHP